MRIVMVVGMGLAVGVLVGGLWWFHASQVAPGEVDLREVRVAAASDLRFALEDVLAELHRCHPDIQVPVSFGSSGNSFAQLHNRAPFDLFFSADMEYPRLLAQQGLAKPGSEFLYGVGHLVLWVPRDSRLEVEKLGIRTLLDPSVRNIAIANPRHAPYGRAAEAALKSLGIYDQVQQRLVCGDNVAQTAQFIQSGSAEIGIIALSLALAPPLRDQGRFWEIPLQAYPHLEQGGVILAWARDPEAAEAVRAFVIGAQGRKILHGYGFSLPGE
jgi:molybdate transport system substrate-binding protein